MNNHSVDFVSCYHLVFYDSFRGGVVICLLVDVVGQICICYVLCGLFSARLYLFSSFTLD